jgi:CubicO group peptidase (beta-lactamase class C family)
VQRTSGEDFFAYTEKHVLGPIGMRQSSMRQPLPQRLVPDMSIGYKDGKPTEGFEILGPWPAGSLSASGTDMGRFMIAHLQRGEIDGQRVLKPETADMMHNSPLAKVDPSRWCRRSTAWNSGSSKPTSTGARSSGIWAIPRPSTPRCTCS